jgi:peptide deformylase
MELSLPKDVEGAECSDVTIDEAEDMMDKGYEMIEFCKEKVGIGMAGPQVGINKNIMIKRGMLNPVYEIIFNPSFYKEGGTVRTVEGCLTYPGKHFFQKRFKRIGVVYYIWSGEKFLKRTKKVKGMEAFVWQHEIDHLKGKTIAMKGELVDEEKINKRVAKDGKPMEIPVL